MLNLLLQSDSFRISMNTYAIVGIYALLVVIALYVTNTVEKLKKILHREEVKHYITTEAKLKAIELNINAIINCDSEGKILTWNKGASKIFGWDEFTVVGKCISLIIPDGLKEVYKAELQQYAQTGFSELFGKTIKINAVTKTKKEIPVEINLSQWRSDTVVYFTAIIIDVTQQKKLEFELEKLMNLYKEAESIQRYGAWKWNLITDEVTTTQGFREIYEIGVGKESYAESISRIHYEDRQRVEDTIKQGIKNKADYSINYRIIAKDGRIKRIENKARVWIGESGVEKIYGVVKEILD